MSLTYDAGSGIPNNLKPGDEIFLFDSEVGALHDCTFHSYGEPDEDGERTIIVIERGEQKTYTEEGIADIVYQVDYPCS
jgi:hypothetical protein